MKADYKGHKNLADMVSTHTDVWRGLLLDTINRNDINSDYYKHELKALTDIEDAIKMELVDCGSGTESHL